MILYLYKCVGCDVIKAMPTFGGSRALYACSVCKEPKYHSHLMADEGDMCAGSVRTGYPTFSEST